MAEKLRVDFSDEGIAHVLGDRNLKVPIHQRSYSWGIEQVEDYWNDLRAAMKGASSEYFMGTVVLTAPARGGDGKESIIDGQQRLATTAILLAAIATSMEQLGEGKRAEAVRAQYLARHEIRKNVRQSRLTLNSMDSAFFDELIIQDDRPAARLRSHERIAATHDLLLQRVNALVVEVGKKNAGDYLADWVEFLAQGVKVIAVRVRDDADAYLIFETLNDRGLDLAIADLLKNYLFGRAGRQLDTVRDAWAACLGALDMSAEDATFKTFLRHYWSSKHGATRERELFKSIRSEVTTESQAVALARDLQEGARRYAAILNPSHEEWADFGTAGKNNLETLLRLEIQQHRPLLLAAMERLEKSELKKLLRRLVAWQLRGIIVGGIGGGTAERVYCDAAVGMHSGKVKRVRHVLQAIETIVPGDKAFRESFAVATITKSRIARYVQLALQREAAGKTDAELVPNSDEDAVTLEHVLPKNADAQKWKAFEPDERRDYLHRIGNMVLLSRGENKRLGNKSFSEKRASLAKSSFSLTRNVGELSEWTPDQIDKTQRELAKLAVAVWPR